MKCIGGPVDEACDVESQEVDDVVKDLRKGINARGTDSEILAYLQKKVGEISDEEYGQVTYRSRKGPVN